MKIFKAEKEAGLSAQIKASSSVAYVTKLEPVDPSTALAQKLIKAVASEKHPAETLYPMKDILVSTGWNLNFDVFEKGEAFIARNTPVHHPLNIEHDENRIVGVITSSQAVDENFSALADDMAIDELPEKFHILNGSVLYRVWSDAEQQKFIDTTIAEIERGEWFVSMECVFKGFDYAVIRPDGSAGIIPRNEESAWMTKHLRQYGGTGTIAFADKGEFKVGRVLRNITFSGKGLVRRPANPESIILNNVTAFVPTFASLGYIKTEEEVTSTEPERKNMSEPNTDMQRLEERVGELLRENKTLADQLKARDGEATKAEIDGLKVEIKNRDSKIENLTASVTELNKTVSELTKRAEDAEKAKSDAQGELDKLRAENTERSRLALMTGKGATPEKAAELVKKFSKFTDEEFSDIVESLSAAWKPAEGKKPEEVINEASAKAKKDGEVSLAAGTELSEEDKVKERIAKASKLVGGFLRYNKNVQE